ncbi:MAG: helix-turn-helix domain containing protein, partial [Nonomuraea sp.]|nr:helix-turn-helix domain containing protein [Nonomuraea sp.]
MGAAAPLHLSERDRCILRSWADKDRKSALGIRAEIILLGGQGISNAAIARRLGVTRPTVVNWRRRYRDEGVLGLQDRPRPGRRRAVEDVEVILRTLVEPTPAARWSSRLLAERLGVSNGTVARVWRRWGLKPDELHDFRLPTMPAAALGAGDVTGLFCTP